MMTRDELEKRNIGENLDVLMNLDPRGYGVCRILYEGSRKAMGEPIAMHAAEAVVNTVKEGDLVYILMGFVLLPHKVPEMDGMVSSMLLARSLVLACGAKPVIVCPEDCVEAVKKCASVVGLHIYEDLQTVKDLPLSMGVVAFTKDISKADAQAEQMMETAMPSMVISVEAPGANKKGVYHNAVGMALVDIEAHSDVLWQKLYEKGVPNVAIGDLGNEIGMGTIAEHIKKYVPFTDEGQCKCDCKGGILSATKTDNIITATVSDWGCYGLMAAIAYLKKDMDIFHNPEMETELMRVASRSGMIDMTGSLLPGIDGFNSKLNAGIVNLMRQCTAYGVRYSHNSDHWFGPVIEKEFFEKG